MKKMQRVLKVSVMVVTAAAGSAAAYLCVRRPAMAPPSDVRAQATPERLARGKYLFTLADCDGCHSERDFSRFGGPVVEGRRGVGTVFPPSMGLPGLVAPPNITLMPWLNFSQLPPEDLKTIYAYLHSRPPVYNAVETHPGFDPEPVKRAGLEERLH